MGFFSSTKAKLAASKLAEEQLYAQAAEEVASGQIRQGLWAKAIAEADGDETAAKGRYLKLRVEIMRAEAEVVDFATREAARESERQTVPQEKEVSQNNDDLSGLLIFAVMLIALWFIVVAFFGT